MRPDLTPEDYLRDPIQMRINSLLPKTSSLWVAHRLMFSLATAALVAACSGQAAMTTAQNSALSAAPTSELEQCRIALATEPSNSSMRFDQTRLRLINWNTHKNTAIDMQTDLSRLAAGADLILLQEAVSDGSALAQIDPDYYLSFAQGYQRAEMITGVMTASRIKPVAQCNLTHYEPWLQSPKATSITEFALLGSNETLLVINLHLINFTFGTQAMAQQLLEALSLVELHQGPVIVSGDFNTWRQGRSKLVANALRTRGLQPVNYEADVRKRFFGYALDHTYVRGVRATHGTSYAVASSDHNPMSITLEF